jgi:hypothetical protein
MEIQGGDKLAKALEEIAANMAGSVRVGFLESATYPDGTPVAAVAFWDEFGTTTAPARPFFRTTITEKSSEWADRLAKSAVHFEYDSDKILNLMGQTIAEDIQQSIVGWTDPENAPSTVAKKGFNKPLIDKGVMQRSVDYEVEK